ncbi:MAG: hypothetical protein ACI9FJ_002729, partial [Alteromonadaceae bacterium]
NLSPSARQHFYMTHYVITVNLHKKIFAMRILFYTCLNRMSMKKLSCLMPAKSNPC